MEAYTLSHNKTIGRVFLGLFGTLLAAAVGVAIGTQVPLGLIAILSIAELVMIFVAMFRQSKKSVGYLFVYSFTLISGVTLWPIIHSYALMLGPGIVIKALAVASASFLVASIVASRSSFDFSFLPGILFIGFLALLLMGIISLFTGYASMASLLYSFLGVAIFVGYILYDVNRITHQGVAEQQVPWVVLCLYLDFINLFLFVLRLMGVLGSSDRR